MHDNLQNSEMALQKYSLNECVYFLWHTQRNKEATPPQTQSSPHVTYMHVLSPLVKIGPLVTCKLTTFTQVLYSTCISRSFYLTVFGCKYCFCSSYHYFQALITILLILNYKSAAIQFSVIIVESFRQYTVINIHT